MFPLQLLPGGTNGEALRRLMRPQPAPLIPRSYVEHILEQQAAAGVPPSRVVIGGFSQGGAMALLALRSDQQLAGVLALSAFMPLTAEQPLFSGEWAGLLGGGSR